MVIGAVAALCLAGAGFFWWQGRAALERGTPPPDLAAKPGEGPIVLPSGDPNARGASLPSAVRHKQSPEERRFNRYDRNRDGTITRTEMLSTRVKAFQKLDVNRDNLLSFEEWAVKTAERFVQIDTNGDGIISRAEMDVYSAEQERQKAARAAKRAASCSCSPLPPGRGGPPDDDPDG
ncbi:hypothetical protein GTZ99_06555 [Novosphingobium sp. FSY-8]|uniref:EF-hand domain-containing protein n=2 Tax=Novosphingobium ovatum TaxID=1908523 RepID=A0ABW9XCF1_9SPHN|nr:hypothetical protein [Novosphingobium ovatum]